MAESAKLSLNIKDAGSALGDADRSLNAGRTVPGIDLQQEQSQRDETIAKLSGMLHSQIHIVNMDSLKYDALGLSRALRTPGPLHTDGTPGDGKCTL